MSSRHCAEGAMLSRRKFINAGACAICLGAERAGADPDYRGCTLNANEITTRVEPQTITRANGLAPEVPRGLLHGSGDPLFDRALAVTLLKISDVFSVLP